VRNVEGVRVELPRDGTHGTDRIVVRAARTVGTRHAGLYELTAPTPRANQGFRGARRSAAGTNWSEPSSKRTTLLGKHENP
jgi:hypothetical protein